MTAVAAYAEHVLRAGERALSFPTFVALGGVDDEEIPAEPLPIVGHPTLGGDGRRVPVDADCPACGWPERWQDTTTRRFGCINCGYVSDVRNA